MHLHIPEQTYTALRRPTHSYTQLHMVCGGPYAEDLCVALHRDLDLGSVLGGLERSAFGQNDTVF